METKICNICHVEQPLSNFHTKSDGKGGRRPNYCCKKCQSEIHKSKNAAKKIAPKVKGSHKKCPECKFTKPISEFTGNVYQNDGLSRTCKECQHAYYECNKTRISASNKKSQRKNKEKNNARKLRWAKANPLKVRKTNQLYYERNKDKITEYNKKWVKENPLARRSIAQKRNIKKKNGTIQEFTIKQLEQRMEVFGFCCSYCGGAFDHIDHLIPIARGGYHCLANLRPACQDCNLRKGAVDPFVWLQLIPKRNISPLPLP